MTLNSSAHIVLVGYLGWGHIRGLCILAARLAKAQPTAVITFFTSRGTYNRVQDEISRDFSEEEQDLLGNISVVAVAENLDNITDYETFDRSFAEQFRKLVNLESVWCAKKEEYLHVGADLVPNAVIVDLFAYDQLLIIREASPATKVLCWSVAPTYGVLAVMGPFGRDSRGYHRRRVEERMSNTGESLVEAANHVMRVGQSDKVFVPGLPPMYGHEAAPQKMPTHAFKNVGQFHLAAAELYHEADGFIVPTFEAFEPPKSVEAIQDFLDLTSRKMYMVGPLLPTSGVNASENELRQSSKAKDIKAFMEETLRVRGGKSLVYISFGSQFWSGEPEKIWAFIDTLIEKDVPFIFAAASQFAVIPQEIKQKLDTARTGLITPWAPQQFILQSPVTGWFVSHCGLNSVLETISAGVPIIAWPFGAEQPFNALHCAVNLEIAFELFEVRSGNALRVHRTGKNHTGTVDAVRAEAAKVLEQAFGRDGEQVRRNIVELREAATMAWAKDGPARKAMGELVESL